MKKLPSKKYIPASLCAAALATGWMPGSEATVVTLTDPGLIAAFKSGATVEPFDDLPGLTITAYTPALATGFTFSSRNAATSPTFDSGGATPTDPVSNPGAPVAVLTPSGGIAGDVSSGGNVIGPVGFSLTPPYTALEAGAFMEVAMPPNINAAKIGFFVTHGTVLVGVQDVNLGTLESTTVSAGNYVAFTRGSADIKNVSITSGGAFTLDDFTYSFTAGTTGGGNGDKVPDSTSTLNLAVAAIGLGVARWKLGARKA